MKIEQQDYKNAEVVARCVYDHRKLSGEQTSENFRNFKLSHKQLCFALRSQLLPQKLEEAMKMHRIIWDEKESEYPWRVENGDELCSVYIDLEEYNVAELTQQKVWNKRKKEDGILNEATMRSAQRMILIWDKQISKVDQGTQCRADKRVVKNCIENKIRDLIKNIWDCKDTPETNVEVLAIGHRLGEILFQRREYAAAKVIFDDVWTGRKISLMKTHCDTLASGHEYCVSVYWNDVQTDYPRARLVLDETWRARKMVLGESSPGTVSSGSYLALISRRLGEYDLAEPISSWIWERQKATSGKRIFQLSTLYLI